MFTHAIITLPVYKNTQSERERRMEREGEIGREKGRETGKERGNGERGRDLVQNHM